MDNLSNYNISRQQAPDSYSVYRRGSTKGTTGKGKKTDRIQFVQDPTISKEAKDAAGVSVKIIGGGLGSGLKNAVLKSMTDRFVPVTVKEKDIEKKVYVNVNSLSKRLGISKEDIRSAAKKPKGLELLIQGAVSTYVENDKKLDEICNKIIAAHYNENDGRLSPKDDFEGQVWNIKGTKQTSAGKVEISKEMLKTAIGASLYGTFKDETTPKTIRNPGGGVFYVFPAKVGADGDKQPEVIFNSYKVKLQYNPPTALGVNVADGTYRSVRFEGDDYFIHENGIRNYLKGKTAEGVETKIEHSFLDDSHRVTVAPPFGKMVDQKDLIASLTTKERFDCMGQLLTGMTVIHNIGYGEQRQYHTQFQLPEQRHGADAGKGPHNCCRIGKEKDANGESVVKAQIGDLSSIDIAPYMRGVKKPSDKKVDSANEFVEGLQKKNVQMLAVVIKDSRIIEDITDDLRVFAVKGLLDEMEKGTMTAQEALKRLNSIIGD